MLYSDSILINLGLFFQESRQHVIGCTDSSVDNRVDLYDLYVNVPASEISVAPQARGNFQFK